MTAWSTVPIEKFAPLIVKLPTSAMFGAWKTAAMSGLMMLLTKAVTIAANFSRLGPS